MNGVSVMGSGNNPTDVVSLAAGRHITVKDRDGNRYARVIKAVHYPSTLNGQDCVIITLERSAR